MPTPPSALHRFQEAVDWFRDRVPMTEAQWARLTERQRERAFTVSGVTLLNVVKAVWQAVDAAIEKGETFESFQERIGDRLHRAWANTKDNPLARMETVFRNNVQAAYNAGRIRQLRDPDAQRTLPFWRYVVILDSRTSDTCKPLADVVLPQHHPWFRTRVPPLHHRCRSTIIGLTRRAAERVGVTQKPPRHRGSAGFGLMEDDWTPDLKGAPAPLVRTFQRKQRTAAKERRARKRTL